MILPVIHTKRIFMAFNKWFIKTPVISNRRNFFFMQPVCKEQWMQSFVIFTASKKYFSHLRPEMKNDADDSYFTPPCCFTGEGSSPSHRCLG